MQRTHYNSNFTKKQHPIVLVCDHISNAPNIGSLFRMSDAFGIERIIFCGNNIPIHSRKTTKTSRATEKVVPFSIEEDALATVLQLKKESYRIVALEITTKSVPIHTFKFKPTEKIALIIGDEKFGVSEALLDNADAHIHIDMYGQNSSMNVVQATNIALYEATKQWNIL